MKKLIFKALGVFLMCLLAMAIHTNIASAHSLQSSTTQGCGHLVVYLHDTSPATSKCLDTVQSSQSASPDTNVTQCGPDSLHIFDNINLDASDGDVCFIGTGFINMTDVPGPWWWGPLSWNDKASSYETNCTGGTFYSDINGNGSHQTFLSGEFGNFNGSPRLNNDTLSSFIISGSSC